MRYKLIQAREGMGYNQSQFAEILGVNQPMLSRWEAGTVIPSPFYQKKIRGILDNADSELFDIVTSWSVKDILEMLRREFMQRVARISGTSLLAGTSLALVSTPVIEPDEYLEQARVTIADCWDNLNRGAFDKVERALHVHMPTLKRLARTFSPYQGIAANLGVQGLLIQMYLATRNLDFLGRENLCTQAVQLGTLSGDRRIYTVALEWQGYTYTTCYHQPQKAIAIFTDALASLESDALLSKADISIGLALAYAQDGNEIDARDYAERARVAIPTFPELDPSHPHIGIGHSELDQLEGQVYLYLARYFPNSSYAQSAYDAFDKSTSKSAMNQAYRSQAFIRKADALRALDKLSDCVDNLEQGLAIALETGSQRRINDAHVVMQRIPEKWQREDKVISLQQEVSHALVVAR